MIHIRDAAAPRDWQQGFWGDGGSSSRIWINWIKLKMGRGSIGAGHGTVNGGGTSPSTAALDQTSDLATLLILERNL